MYGFSEDENHLLFMDCFGLTRLSRPKQVKTDAKISGSESAARVTVSRDGSLAASYEDLWDKSVLWSFPELKPAKRFDRFRARGAIVHPDGTHYILCEGDELKLEPVSKRVLLPLRLDAPADANRKAAAAVSLKLSGGERLPALSFGGGKRPDVPGSPMIAHDGTLLHFQGDDLICATLRGTKLKVNWRRTVTTPERARLELYADAERCVLMFHRDRRWTIFESKDAKERTFEIDSLGVPAVAGKWLAWQPAADRVVRQDLDTGERTEHSLAIYDKKRKLEASNEGVGTIFLGAKGSMLFLCNHRESLLDLVSKQEIPRKLPAKELDVRQAVLAIARPYVEAARLAGSTLELGRLELNPKYNSVGVSHRISGSDNLFGALLAGHSSTAWRDVSLPGGWRMGSYGGSGGIGYDPDVTVDELVAGYTALAEAGFGFASTIDFWARQFETWGKPPSEPACLALLAQAFVAVLRDGPDARPDFAALAKRGIPTIAEVIAAYAEYPKHARRLEYSTPRLAGGLFNQLYGADAAEIWKVVFLDAPGFAGYDNHYGDYGNYAVNPLLDAHPEVAEAFREWFSSHEIAEDDGRRWYLEQLRGRLG